MPPAAPDDIIRQHSRSLEDDSSFTPDTNRVSEHEPSGKKKKKAKKAKAKAATESPPDEMYVSGDCFVPERAPLTPETMCSIQPSAPPVEPSSCPDPPLEHHVKPSVMMPALDALDSLDEPADNDLASRTDTWAQSVPYGKSPPTDLMDGDIPNASPLNFPTIQERGGFSDPSSASPPPRTQPSSYGNGYRSSMQSRQQSVDRRKSNSYGSPMSNHAPLPHLPQPHFFGAPEIDIHPVQNRSSTDGNYSFCSFETLPTLSPKASRTGTNVLLVGTDGAVEILAIEDRRTRLVGQITGLNGRVIEAKILSGHSSNDPFASARPHVAVIVHGPLGPNEEEGRISSAASDANEIPPSTARGHSGDRRPPETPRFYQTRVEVYSFRTGEHVSTLFASKPVPCLDSLPGMPSFAPPPVGSLKLFTSSAYIMLASGISGEVYIYRHALSSGPGESAYQCLGKTWTGIQVKETRRYSTSSSSTTDPEGTRNEPLHGGSVFERPILAVQGRWLAFVPPSSAYRGSIHGTVPQSLIHGKVPGLETRSPPTVPSISCATDVGEGESFFDKVARGVAQELVKGARWMGDQGMQAWNNYWNTQQPGGTSPRRSAQGIDSPAQGYGLFPPTHGHDTQASSAVEPDTVSIIDLKRFEDGSDIRNVFTHPVSTFQVPNGCSFLSLSPNGLMLFTASKKGDVQYVWDLMQLKHCRSMAFMADDQVGQNPNVRQIARYARLTTSSIVDVIWTAPVGDRLAVITRKGTIHVFDLPRSAFQWPPFRRARPSVSKSPAVDPMAEEVGQTAGGNPLSAAMKLVGGKTQPFFSAVRGRVPSGGAAFPNMSGFALPSAASVKSGKVVAAGLSKSMGAATGTVNTLRHVGENRLHLPGLARDPTPSRVTWICTKGLIFLGVVDGGYFKLYRLKRAVSSHKNRQPHSVVGPRESQVKLPENLQSLCGPAPVATFDPELTVHASLVLPSIPSQASAGRPLCQPLSQAEIETNTPYQPFHTDQRVGLSVFSSGSDASEPSGRWVFGNDIPMTKVHLRSFNSSSDDHGDDEDENAAIHGHSFGAGGDMENLITLGNSTGNVEEVVITTRRKKKYSAPLKADDGFFEDDCEVLDFARDRV
ncbi:hypothetical protein N7508_010963 [Penicillium antarcticum]|uniref:uncharacterized protein n=1 Tax=Penicillium antarcticum TaxID=416450 RepID=UPI0023A591C2|nr:uncharacterized protein N7508_010963 [Penicillium antarcticum]KAJ5296142.1 hypothetical protein N7508_010963 [Penicillium antarcticum]